MAKIICSSEKKEGEEPKQWYSTQRQAQYLFDLEVNWYQRQKNAKIKWIEKPKIIEKEGKFNVIGIAK